MILAATGTRTAIRLGTTGLIAAAGAGLAVLSTLTCWPPARRWIIAWSLCVITTDRRALLGDFLGGRARA